MNSDDSALLEGWKTRQDPECLNRLVRKYAGLVHSAALRITQNPTEAEDVAQESIIVLAQKPPAPGVPVGAWLHRVATHRAIDQMRTESRRRVREDKWAARELRGDRGDGEILDQVRRSVDAAIDALPDIQRTAIISHFIEGQTHERIAEEVGISRPAVTQRIQNGLNSLRKNLVPVGAALDDAALTGLVGPSQGAAAHAALCYKLAGVQDEIARRSRTHATSLQRSPISTWLRSALGAKSALLLILATIAGLGIFYYGVTSKKQDSLSVERIASTPLQPEVEATFAAPSPASPEIAEVASPAPVIGPTPEPPAAATIAPSIDGRVFDRITGKGVSGAVVNALISSAPGVLSPATPMSAGSAGVATPVLRTTTDENGYYSMAGLSTGGYAISLEEIPGYPMTRAGRSMHRVNLQDDQSGARRVDFGLARSGTLVGKISVNGVPMANMNVLVDSQPTLEVSSVMSDERGNYRIEGLGDYSGSLRARGQVSGTLRATPYVSAKIKSGLTTQADFDFLAGSASIEGDVLLHRRDGEVVRAKGKIVVTYAYVDGNEYNIENMDLPTDENGHFLVEGLWGGRVTVGVYPSIPGVHRHRYTFELGDAEKARQDFHFYATQIDVRIARMPADKELDVWLVAIPGHVEKIEGTPAAQRDFVESRQRSVGSVQPDGNGGGIGSLGGLPPGEYTIMASGILGSHTLINHAAGEEFYRRRRSVRTYVTLPENTPQISVELSFPDEP